MTTTHTPEPASETRSADERIATAVRREQAQAIELRHHMHRNPELSNREFETARLVARRLAELGLEVRTGIAHTGVVGVLRGGRSGRVVAARADLDALPVTEDTPYPFRSTVRTIYEGEEVGVSHACGHDVHTAVQLGVAAVLSSMRDELPGTVLFIFQPAEEGAPTGERGGAKLMLDEGVFDDPRPSAIFGLHSFAHMEVGRLGYIEGPMLAAAAEWEAVVRGRQAHAAAPHLSVDPVVMASQVVLALQTIRSRTLSPFTPSVLTVGVIRGGTRHNIIPGEVRLAGTIRIFDSDTGETIERRMHEILDGITRAGGGSYELVVNHGYPVTVNDAGLAARARPTMERIVGRENVLDIEPTTGAEDFGYFAQEVPGFFFRLGSVKPGTVSGGHHTPSFMADDGAIPIGMRVMSALLFDYLSHGPADRSMASHGGTHDR